MATKTASTNQLDRSALARAVVNEGDLPAAGMLLDDLKQKGDPRTIKLTFMLGQLVMTARDRDAAEAKELASHTSRRYSSPEEAAHRVNESHFQLWRSFVRNFDQLFWVELHGSPDLNALKGAADALETPKQAQRLARDRSDPEQVGPMDGGAIPRGEMNEAIW